MTNSLNTPNSTPSSSSQSTFDSQTRRQKRVNFSPWMDYVPPNARLKDLQPSKQTDVAMPKSILKSKNGSPTNTKTSTFKSMKELLESILQELAGDKRDLRFDAYFVLVRTLRAYNDVPDRQTLGDKMHLICQYIRRDLSHASSDSDELDAALISQVLKLVAIFIWDTEVSKLLTDDFRLFVLDRSIQALEDVLLPKSLTILYMNVLATQKFSVKIMTSDRAQRLITAVEDISNRVSGNNVVVQRLMIYLRLLEQARTAMASKVKSWIDHLFSGMFSSIKETRSRAIRFGMQAGLDLGSNGLVSEVVRDLLNMDSETGIKNISYFSERLTQMTATKGDRDQVPQIWSVAILLLRGKRHMISNWAHLKEWLQVIQKCFNCGGSSIETQTYLAWNRLVFALSLDKWTSPSMIRLLRQPIASKFRLQASPNAEKAVKTATLSSYCNLLYYAFRPGTSSAQLELLWDEYILTVMRDSFLSNQENANQACRILCSLFWNPNLVLWNENLAHETKTIEAKDLPRLDCKWIRSKLSSILEIVEALFRGADGNDDSDCTSVTETWTSLTKALGEACSKEVKPPIESKQAIALTCNTLMRIWEGKVASLNVTGDALSDTFLKRFSFLVNTLLSNIGTFPFTETHLTRSSDGSFLIPNALQHRSSQQAASQPAIFELIGLITHKLGRDLSSSSFYLETIRRALTIVVEARPSLDSKVDFCKNIVQWLSEQAQLNLVDSDGLRATWQVTVELVEESLSAAPEIVRRDEGMPLRNHYHSTIGILEIGIPLAAIEDYCKLWNKLLQTVVGKITGEMGRSEATKATKQLVEALEDQEWFQSSNERALIMEASGRLPVRKEQALEQSGDSIRVDVNSRKLKRSSSKFANTRRGHHGDSQVEFTAIEFPLFDLEPNSQSLTVRQKEVQERQRSEACSTFRSLWPNSGSQSLSNDNAEPTLPPMLKIPGRYNMDEELPSTPTLPVHSTRSDDVFIGSSPTPGSKHDTPMTGTMDVPSSPLSIQDLFDPPSSPPVDEELADLNEIISTVIGVNSTHAMLQNNVDPVTSNVIFHTAGSQALCVQGADDVEDMSIEDGGHLQSRDMDAHSNSVERTIVTAPRIIDHEGPRLNAQDAFVLGTEEHVSPRPLGTAGSSSKAPPTLSDRVGEDGDAYIMDGPAYPVTLAGPALDEFDVKTDSSQPYPGAPNVHNSSSVQVPPSQPLPIGDNPEATATPTFHGQADVHDPSEVDETEFLISSQLSNELERSFNFDELPASEPLPVLDEIGDISPASKKRKRAVWEQMEEPQRADLFDMSTPSNRERPFKKLKEQLMTSSNDDGDYTSELRTEPQSPSLGRMGRETRTSKARAVSKRRGVSLRQVGVSTNLENETPAPGCINEEFGGQATDNAPRLVLNNDQKISAEEARPSIRSVPPESSPESIPTPPPSSPLVRLTHSNSANGERPSSGQSDGCVNLQDPSDQKEDAVQQHQDTPSSGAAILSSLRGLLGQLKEAKIGSEELREMDGLLLDLRKEAWEAVTRGMR
jgi:hypothetical protein